MRLPDTGKGIYYEAQGEKSIISAAEDKAAWQIHSQAVCWTKHLARLRLNARVINMILSELSW